MLYVVGSSNSGARGRQKPLMYGEGQGHACTYVDKYEILAHDLSAACQISLTHASGRSTHGAVTHVDKSGFPPKKCELVWLLILPATTPANPAPRARCCYSRNFLNPTL